MKGTELARTRIRFAVKFAGLALDSLRPGDWQNLRQDFDGYCGSGVELEDSAGVTGRPIGSMREFSGDDWRSLQREIRSVLNPIVDRPNGPPATPSFALACKKHLLLLGPQDPTLMLVIKGSIRDVFLELLLDALNTAARLEERVRRCPQCQGLFFAPRQRGRPRKHCSSACYDRWFWAQYPAEKKRLARTKEYEKHGWKTRKTGRR